MRRCLHLLLFCLPSLAQPVDVGVFSLFRPTELTIRPVSGPILISAGELRTVLEGRQSFHIRLARESWPVRVSARDGSYARFVLSVPGKIERTYLGTLGVRARGRKLVAVVTMDREIAVASVVAAEMPASAPIEALKAQAVVARSFFAAAGSRHDDYAFCDTTHCQFLREPTDAARRAAVETSNLLVEFQGKPIAAFYSASCGGRTRSLEAQADGYYSYRAVDCEFCRRSSPGVVRGHQLGLCQTGAAGMAATGATFRAILEHYLPSTYLSQDPGPALSIFLLPHASPLRHSKD